ncbi:MAG: GyrI-like domain-containing protein [Planctomycetota bacterium]
MNYETVTRDEFELVGLETRASNDDPTPIGALWGRFFGDALMQSVVPVDDDVVAVYCEYEGDHTKPYTFFLGRRVHAGTKVPGGLTRRSMPGGTFARFVAEGEQPAVLIQAWQSIWETPIERRFDCDYEVHPPGGGDRVEIFVGVQ